MLAVRVARFGGPEVLELEDIPTPSPSSGEVLVQVHAAGVNPVDVYIRAGTYARLPQLPYTPGWDGAGTVAKTGSQVERYEAGERVYFSGTASGRGVGAYAEYACCRAHQVHPLPSLLSFEQGAAIGVPYATAHRALFYRAKVQVGETALIHGASGGVGIAAVQLARAHGLTVIGTAGSEAGLSLVQEAGAHHGVLHGRSGTVDQVREMTGGKGVDVIIEMLANANLDRDLALLAPRGRVVVVGSRGRIEIDPRQTMTKDSAILGMSLWNSSDSELLEIHRQLGSGLSNGVLRPVVGEVFPLAEAARAHDTVMRSGAKGKVVLRTKE